MSIKKVAGVTLADILRQRRTITVDIPIFGTLDVSYNPNAYTEEFGASIDDKMANSTYLAALDARFEVPQNADSTTVASMTQDDWKAVGAPQSAVIVRAINRDFFPPAKPEGTANANSITPKESEPEGESTPATS